MFLPSPLFQLHKINNIILSPNQTKSTLFATEWSLPFPFLWSVKEMQQQDSNHVLFFLFCHELFTSNSGHHRNYLYTFSQRHKIRWKNLFVFMWKWTLQKYWTSDSRIRFDSTQILLYKTMYNLDFMTMFSESTTATV